MQGLDLDRYEVDVFLILRVIILVLPMAVDASILIARIAPRAIRSPEEGLSVILALMLV